MSELRLGLLVSIVHSQQKYMRKEILYSRNIAKRLNIKKWTMKFFDNDDSISSQISVDN